MKNKDIKKGMRELLRQFDWDYFVTVNFNRATNWEGARKNLKEWHGRLDRQLLGGRWAKKLDKRTFFIAFSEGGETNLHWHMMVKVADGKHEKFEKNAARLLRGIVKSGTLDVQKLATKDDELRTSNYSIKDLWRDEAVERFVMSTEFCCN